MQTSLTQSERTTLAHDAVSALRDLTDALEKNQKSNNSTLLRGLETGEIFRDGVTSLAIQKIDKRFQKQSSHEELSDYALENKFKDLFEKCADNLKKLFPGRYLLIKRSPMTGTPRYSLTFGSDSSQHVTPINTTLSRWKTPLIRLSRYFDGIDCGDGTLHSWFIHPFSPDASEDGTFISYSVRVDARSLEEAHRLEGFNQTSGSTPSPHRADAEFAVRHAGEYTFKQYKQSLEDYAEATKDTHSAIIEKYESENADRFNEFKSLLAEATNSFDVLLKFDLISGAYESRLTASPLVTRQDAAKLPSIKEKIDTCAVSLFSSLKSAFHQIHPKSQRAVLNLDAKCHRVFHRVGHQANHMTQHYSDSFPGFNIDGQMRMDASKGPQHFFKVAAKMAHAIEDVPLSIYSLQDAHSLNTETIGNAVKTLMVQATSFRHAAAILGSKFQSYTVIREAIPVDIETIEASLLSQELAYKAYNQK